MGHGTWTWTWNMDMVDMAWCVHGVCKVCACMVYMHGVCMVCAWCVQAFQLAALDTDLADPHELNAGLATPTKPAARAAPATPSTPPTPRMSAAPTATSIRAGAASCTAAPAESTAGGLQPVSSTCRVPRRLDGVASDSPEGLRLMMRAASATTVCLCFESSPASGSPPSPPRFGRLSPQQQALVGERPQILFDYFR